MQRRDDERDDEARGASGGGAPPPPPPAPSSRPRAAAPAAASSSAGGGDAAAGGGGGGGSGALTVRELRGALDARGVSHRGCTTRAELVALLDAAPPLPTPFRCFEFGESVAQAISGYDKHLRVGIIGSGGISHAPPSGDVESEAPDDAAMVERLIHGRALVEANEQARQEGLVSGVLAGRFRGSVRPEWDRMILDKLAHGEAASLARNLDEASIDRDGGCGAQEIRTWLAVGGACGGAPMEVVGYEPIDFLITGMGAVRAL